MKPFWLALLGKGSPVYKLFLNVNYSSGQWIVDFDDNNSNSDQLTVASGTGSDEGRLTARFASSVDAIVTRHSSATYATVNWKKNGGIVHTELFTETDMSSLGYTYTGLVAGDSLEIEVVSP